MKRKTLFEHIAQITTVSDPNYYESLSEDDKKTYSVFMIHRFLSMNPEWIETVNEMQKYSQQLKQVGTHKVYDEIIPKRKIFLKYVKPSTEKKYNQQVLDILKRHFELGEAHIKEYYDIYMKSSESKEAMLDIVRLYGLQEKEYKIIENEIYGLKTPKTRRST